MKISIIILSFNTAKFTKSCADSVLQQYKDLIGKEVEVIVVDNASSDNTINLLSKYKNIKIIKNDKNYGFSKGNNIGAKIAKGKYLLFLNSDTVVRDSNFLSMAKFLDENKKIGILGGKLIDSNKKIQKSGGNFYNLLNLFLSLFGGERVGLVRKTPAKRERVDWVSGACLFIRGDLFKRLKGFDEHFFMYVEDMDLCFRAKKAGFLTYFFPEVELVHSEHGSSNREFAVVSIYRSIIYFAKKHKLSSFFVRLMLFIKALVSLLIGIITNNNYLKKTYIGAIKIAI